jgi:hypothetical protein
LSVFYQCNGITYESTGGDFANIGKAANDHGIDILGIAETHLDTTQFPVRDTIRKAALRNIDTTHIKLVTASRNRQYNSYRKPGGTLLLTQGHTTSRCQKTFSDEMGRKDTPRAAVRKLSPMKWAAGAAPHIWDKMGAN